MPPKGRRGRKITNNGQRKAEKSRCRVRAPALTGFAAGKCIFIPHMYFFTACRRAGKAQWPCPTRHGKRRGKVKMLTQGCCHERQWILTRIHCLFLCGRPPKLYKAFTDYSGCIQQAVVPYTRTKRTVNALFLHTPALFAPKFSGADSQGKRDLNTICLKKQSSRTFGRFSP